MRFLLTLRREIYTQKKLLTIYVITAFIILFVTQAAPVLIAAVFGLPIPAGSSYNELFSLFLFIGGGLYTSTLFQKDMFSKDGNHGWLMLPASTAEKFFAKGLLSVAYPFALIIFFALTSLFTEGLLTLTAGTPFLPFSPFVSGIWQLVAHALVIQSIFLLGAVFFRKAHFSKTVLSLCIVFIVLGIIATLSMLLLFRSVIGGGVMYGFRGEEDILLTPAFSLLKAFGTALYWAILPLFCWITSYIRVEEVQYTDAVR